jgi:hypothetical protein
LLTFFIPVRSVKIIKIILKLPALKGGASR